MPLLYFDDVAQAMGLATREEVALRIEQSITRVLSNQAANGAFGLWGPYSGDLWLDAYVTDFLSRARARDFAVPEIAWQAALDNLRNRVNYYPDFETGGEDIGYALMVLARESAAAVGDLRYFADERAFAFTTPTWPSAQLGAALGLLRRPAARRCDVPSGGQPVGQPCRRNAAGRCGGSITAARGAIPPPCWRWRPRPDRPAVDAAALTARLAGAGQEVSTQEAAWTLIGRQRDDPRPARRRPDGERPAPEWAGGAGPP